MKNIEEFVDKLVSEKGFDTQDPEVLAQIKSDLLERVGDRVNAMIMSAMPEEKLSEFEGVLDSKDDEKIANYVKEQIPDIDERTATVLLSFKNSYLS
jgi:hypothetical protein